MEKRGKEGKKIKVKLTPYLKKIIKSLWYHNEMLYVLCINKYITKLTKYFSKEYGIPEERVRVGTMEDLIKKVTEHNTRVLVSIRDGKIIYDPLSFIKSIKINIKKGAMIGTKEAILRKFLLIKDNIKKIKSTKIEVFDNIYTATVEASQTALILKGHTIMIPKLIPEMLKKYLKGKGLEKSHIKHATEIIKTFKDYEHKKIPLPSGKKLDDLARKAELFREAIKRIK